MSLKHATGIAMAACFACDGARSSRVTADAAVTAASSVAAPADVVSPLAPAALQVATAIAGGCALHFHSENTLSERCEWSDAQASALRQATNAFLASTDVPRRGTGASFAAHLRMFADWIEFAGGGRRAGTLAHYQELARAWNEWQPTKEVSVDPGKNYTHYRDAGVLAWSRCSDGPCVVISESFGGGGD